MPPKYMITNDSITVVYEGKSYTVKVGSPQYTGLRHALTEGKWEAVPNFLTVARSIETWAKGEFTFENNRFKYRGKDLPHSLNTRIASMASNGENPTYLFRFWERLLRNPSFRSVEQLWPFLEHKSIPIGPDGCFYAYKRVDNNYKDHHTHSVINTPGTINEMPRNEISDDPNKDCHYGFHVGAYEYARTFSRGEGKIVICKVDPEHVVCVPYDSSQQKMRVCKYEVYGNYGTELPSTVFEDEVIPPPSPSTDEDMQEEVVVTPKTEGTEPRKLKKGYAKLHKMNVGDLMELSIAELRQYATYGLDIVGSSKIPGGKTALVARIVEVRDQ